MEKADRLESCLSSSGCESRPVTAEPGKAGRNRERLVNGVVWGAKRPSHVPSVTEVAAASAPQRITHGGGSARHAQRARALSTCPHPFRPNSHLPSTARLHA
jgi:hypothetical protein